MRFSSLVFLCIFLPIVFGLHSVVRPIKVKNALLIVASLLFYAFGEPVYVLLMIASAIANYLFARLIDRTHRRAFLVLAVCANIGALCVFKYTGFLVESINRLLGIAIPVPAIALPIGISFFTFQALSYVIDVWRGNCAVQRNFFKVLLYISFFPQLIAGPIVKYRDIAREIDDRSATSEEMAAGMVRFVLGLSKKVLIANAMAVAADAVFAQDPSALNVAGAWIGAVAYTLQIYFDFSGYSDMAIGLGRMFGFHFKENFLQPYTAVTIQDFWRRWHVSLSSWFKEYVYIPLGGNRKGALRASVNRWIVFFLTGLWHGANWTFVVWGLYHGLFLFVEQFVPALKKLPRVLLHLYTMLVVTIGFVIFRADTLTYGVRFIGCMFTGFDFSAAPMSFALQQLTPFFLAMLVLAILCCIIPALPIAQRLTANIKGSRGIAVQYLLCLLLLAWCILRLSGGSYDPFIYFRF